MQTITMRNPQEIYRRQDVLTASPIELIIMLYDGLQKNMVLAQRSIRKGDMPGAHNYLMKAQDILTELLNSLDMRYPISTELATLYDFILRHLINANIKKDEALISEALELVRDLRGAWKDVCDSQKGLMYQEAGL